MSKSNSPVILLFLFLTLICGIALNWPYHNFQQFLSQGDHGRDLYAGQAVLRGQLPYRDFWWVYGPLMPYYYGLMYKTFGMFVSSLLMGKLITNVAAGLFFFLAFAELFPAVAAFVAGTWFMAFHQDFFFTYNHAGGIAVMLAVLWMHCAYIKKPRMAYAWTALAAVFILGLIKINFGITALVMTLFVIGFNDRRLSIAINSGKKAFYTTGFLLLPLAWLAIYAWLLQGLSIAEIRQCLPYLPGDEPYNNASALQTIPNLIIIFLHTAIASWFNIGFAILVWLCAGTTLYLFRTHKFGPARASTLLFLLAYLCLFYVFNLHEYIKSGVMYRAFWAQPLSIFLTFALIASAVTVLASWMRWVLWGLLLLVVGFSWNVQTGHINALKTPQHYLGGKYGHVYLGNERDWIQTVVLTTRQLDQLKPNELFFALPYDALYYYLTDKKSPTRQLIFFDHINIHFEQEQKIIKELENNHISAVLVSSRQSTHEHGLGTLGVTYCPLITQYINTNFVPVAKIGDWVHEPGWAWNHGTLLLKRK